MLIKFLKYGKGSCQHAITYLLAEYDHKGEKRAHIKVLRGNPNHVVNVADSIRNEWKYTSAVIAFHEQDRPSDQQINCLLDDFEEQASAGLGIQRLAMTAIEHGESNGNRHIHIVCARCDLATGLAYNIAPPGSKKRYNSVAQYYNELHNWRRPDDVNNMNKKGIQPKHNILKKDKGAVIHKGQQSNIAAVTKKKLDIELRRLVRDKDLRNRAELFVEIRKYENLRVTRQGKNYITVTQVSPSGNKKIRLKGDIYEEHAQYTTQMVTDIQQLQDAMLVERKKVELFNMKRFKVASDDVNAPSLRELLPELNLPVVDVEKVVQKEEQSKREYETNQSMQYLYTFYDRRANLMAKVMAYHDTTDYDIAATKAQKILDVTYNTKELQKHTARLNSYDKTILPSMIRQANDRMYEKYYDEELYQKDLQDPDYRPLELFKKDGSDLTHNTDAATVTSTQAPHTQHNNNRYDTQNPEQKVRPPDTGLCKQQGTSLDDDCDMGLDF